MVFEPMVGPATFAGSVLLIIAILVGLITAVVTYMNSRKLQGEVFEAPFVYFSIGLLLVTFSLIVVALLQPFMSEVMVATVHDVSFILGFALMLVASLKITNFLTGIEKFTKKLK